MTDQPRAASTAGTSVRGLSVQGTAIVGAGLVTSQIIAMLQMLVVSRLLDPVEFGAFGALAVLLLLGSTAMAATQVVIARHVASGRSSEHVGAGAVLGVGLLTCMLTLALSPLISRALNLPGLLGLVVVGATFIPFTVTGAQLGLLQGAERHKRLGVLYVVATGMRVTGAIAGAALGGTAQSTTVGLAIGAAVGALAGQFLLVGQPPWGSKEEGTRDFLVEVGHAAHALIALYALTNLDVLIARAQLPAYDAGLYAAGGLIARAVFFLPQAVIVAAFPRMVAGARNAQRQALLGVAGLGLLATAVVALVPRLIVTIMSGDQYLAVAQDAWIFALAGAGFGVVQVLLYARMAHHDRRATILLWSGVAGLALLGLTLGTSIHALITVTAVVAWTVALAGLVWARTSPPPAPTAEVDEPIVTPPA
ncbi:MAG: oligosaccharide flippase family protein [Actinomycetota bacterium]|nr:oligosaccharide flippase family protein [Actinomycetota bacterium]